MPTNELEIKYRSICRNIVNRNLSKAFALLKELELSVHKSEISDRINRLSETYNQMLHYTFTGINDPKQAEVYRKMQTDLLALADKLHRDILIENHSLTISAEQKLIEKQIIRNEAGIQQYTRQISEFPKNDTNNLRKQKVSDLFTLIWLSDNLSDNDIEILQKYSKSSKMLVHERCLIVSALTISTFRYFDERKIRALFDLYDTKNSEVKNRAFIGLVLVLYVYNERIHIYKNIESRMKMISETAFFSENMEHIVLQMIKTRETEKISDKLRNDIIPEIEKFKPKIEDKLNLDNILSDNLIEDKNPDWEEIFEDAPDLLNKMAEYSQMQLEGSDIFMSAFSMLKNFPFFNRISNWFLPFYADNQDIIKSIESQDSTFEPEVFFAGLERSVYMCNSDKYSFCLNIGMMPAGQRKMITELFKMEAESMDEINETDSKIDGRLHDRQIMTRYIQDLYRFFKIHPLRNEIFDIFDEKLDIYNTLFFKTTGNDSIILRKAAEMLFIKEYYTDAVDAFLLIDISEKNAAGIYEKIGFSYQKQKRFTEALEYYNKAELYGSKSQWLIKKIAFCYRKILNFEKALHYYRKTEMEQPDNLHVQANIAHCLLSLEKYDEALKYYFKVEYFDPENKLVMRPLAWCSFLTNKLDSAEKYYQKLINSENNAFDLINFGHVLLAKNNKSAAVENYIKARKILGLIKLIENIQDDTKYLTKAGISETDIDLLIDYLTIKK